MTERKRERERSRLRVGEKRERASAYANNNESAGRQLLLRRRTPRKGLLKIIPTCDDIVHFNGGGLIESIACCVTKHVRYSINAVIILYYSTSLLDLDPVSNIQIYFS